MSSIRPAGNKLACLKKRCYGTHRADGGGKNAPACLEAAALAPLHKSQKEERNIEEKQKDLNRMAAGRHNGGFYRKSHQSDARAC